MKRNYNKLISTIFIKMVEKLAFIFGDETEKEELIQNSSQFIQTRITFNGAMNVALTLVVSENTCFEIAAITEAIKYVTLCIET